MSSDNTVIKHGVIKVSYSHIANPKSIFVGCENDLDFFFLQKQA
jgi:hypothetical protein